MTALLRSIDVLDVISCDEAGDVHVWNADKGDQLLEIVERNVALLAVAPNMKLALSGTGNQMYARILCVLLVYCSFLHLRVACLKQRVCAFMYSTRHYCASNLKYVSIGFQCAINDEHCISTKISV